MQDVENIAEQFFSKNEYLKLKSVTSHDKLQAFFKCWTRKEAFVKAIGNGISCPLHEFEVSLLPNEIAELLKIKGSAYLASKWKMFSFTPYYNYESAFVFDGNYKHIEFFEFK